MSLYHHVANKDGLLDALADWIFAAIDLPGSEQPWRAAMFEHASSARTVLSGHPWALGLIESRRSPGPALLRHHNTVIGCLLRHGFSIALVSHAFSVIDAYVYGFVLTEQNLPFAPEEGAAEEFVAGIDLPRDDYPHLVEVATTLLGKDYTYGDELAYGLDLILDALEVRLAAEHDADPG